MIRIWAASLLLFLSSVCMAGEVTEALVLDLLAKEKRYMQEKDIQGFSSLLADGFQSAFKDRTVGKEESLANIGKVFLTASKILYMPQLLSMKVSDDRQSADIQLRIVEKYLYEIGQSRNVESYSNLSAATVILEGGLLKYKYSKYLRTE